MDIEGTDTTVSGTPTIPGPLEVLHENAHNELANTYMPSLNYWT